MQWEFITFCRASASFTSSFFASDFCNDLSYFFVQPSYFIVETRSLPALARCYPRSFTFYVAHPTRSILTSHFQIHVLSI